MAKAPPDLSVLFARLRAGDGEALGAAIRRDWTFAHSWLKTHLKPIATA